MATAFNMCHRNTSAGWERAKKGEYEDWLLASNKNRQITPYITNSLRPKSMGAIPIVVSNIKINLEYSSIAALYNITSSY